MVENLDRDALHRIYVNLLISNAACSTSQGKFKVVDGENGPRAIADFSETNRLGCFVISESVLLYSKDDGMKSFVDMCGAVTKLLVSSFYSGLPMRGAIALGPLSLFSGGSAEGEFGVHGLVGLPLVRAYQSESAYDWAGCVVDDACVQRYESEVHRLAAVTPDIATIDYLVSTGLLLQYRAPAKSGESNVRWAANWPRQNRGGVSDAEVINSFAKHGKSVGSAKVQKIVDNTMAFLRYSRSHAANEGHRGTRNTENNPE